MLGGIAIGGIVFGTGMAILGYCPGTLPVSLGEGSVDALISIIGARMAGGCTSGHILSGGMQLAVSSLVFAAFVFSGLLLTGKYFYKYKS